MKTHSQILRDGPKAEAIAETLSVSVHTVRSWMQRDSIPAEHWAAISALGWATLEDLASYAAKSRVAAQ